MRENDDVRRKVEALREIGQINDSLDGVARPPSPLPVVPTVRSCAPARWNWEVLVITLGASGVSAPPLGVRFNLKENEEDA